ncbi:hypothetical protein QBC32DRAFT_218364 [Pseudoneurospora amorphoporcata]|uniref:Uncharacterized protein n=1 Tax=Pseudoneurospora amorphoporcata TaxID=241081 RepID=A0AAN6SDV9_9PEZI|nr:hypothetical protein QBC32DRAFT_218364 [Pseudoneurospora amorphoporcata]
MTECPPGVKTKQWARRQKEWRSVHNRDQKKSEEINAPAANRTRGPSMATMDFTTKPLALLVVDRRLGQNPRLLAHIKSLTCNNRNLSFPHGAKHSKIDDGHSQFATDQIRHITSNSCWCMPGTM